MELEPWMRGTHAELDPVRRGVIHALELAGEDVERWCGALTKEEIFARPHGLPPVAFHLRHMARSLDRLLSYAEERALDESQLRLLGTEMPAYPAGSAGVAEMSPQRASSPGTPEAEGAAEEVLREFRDGLWVAKERVRGFSPDTFGQVRGIGRKQLPTTVGGLLIHCAEHTARHVGQAVTTAKLVAVTQSSREEAVR